METRWNVSGLYWTRNCTCVPIFVAVRVRADSPRFLGNGYASLCGMGGCWADASKLLSGVVHLWEGMEARGLKGSLKYPPNVASTVPAPTFGDGLADLAVLLPLLQSLGLPEEVLELVRARVAQPKAPKKGF